MALMKDGLWGMVLTPIPATTVPRPATLNPDEASATIVLSVEPSLLYLMGDPQDPIAVWKEAGEPVSKENKG